MRTWQFPFGKFPWRTASVSGNPIVTAAALSTSGPTDDTPATEGRSAVTLLAIVSGIFATLTAAYYVWTLSFNGGIPRDATTLIVGRDFLQFWMYGRAAWMPHPGQFYDLQVYNDAIAALLGPGYPGQNWPYAPNIMLFTAPFGKLPYLAALGTWLALGLAVFISVGSRLFGWRRALVAVVLSPAAVFCLISGQASFVTAAILLTIFANLDRRPNLAGILIGVLTVKPQLGLLFPVLLIASGRWRVFTVAAATGVAIVGLTTAVFGTEVWSDFLVKGLAAQKLVMDDPDRLMTRFIPTFFVNVRGVGASYGLATAVQVCAAILALGAVAFAGRYCKDADPQYHARLFLACSICAVPYFMAYDTLALTCAAVLLLAREKLDARGCVLAKLVFWLPLLQMVLGTWHIPGPALVPAAFAADMLWRMTRARDAQERDTRSPQEHAVPA